MQGYWLILAGDVTDPAAQAHYAQMWQPLAARYGATLRVLDRPAVLVETQGHTRVMVVAFDRYETAVACYHDAAYQQAMGFAQQAARREVLVLRGEPPQ
jgi:uncharacterized protein (DUF1330 family)